MATFNLTKRGFKAYLEELYQKDSMAFAGRSCDSMYCPIHNYLDDVMDIDAEVAVEDIGWYDANDRHHERKPPKWAQDFISTLDSRFPERYVTAYEALLVLDPGRAFRDATS